MLLSQPPKFQRKKNSYDCRPHERTKCFQNMTRHVFTFFHIPIIVLFQSFLYSSNPQLGLSFSFSIFYICAHTFFLLFLSFSRSKLRIKKSKRIEKTRYLTNHSPLLTNLIVLYYFGRVIDIINSFSCQSLPTLTENTKLVKLLDIYFVFGMLLVLTQPLNILTYKLKRCKKTTNKLIDDYLALT